MPEIKYSKDYMNSITIKKDFAIFTQQPELSYLDSAATSLTPRCVVDKIIEYYEQYNANIARGVYDLSEKATAEYEESRRATATFLGAQEEEIIFTSGTTMSLNMVAHGLQHTLKDDANIVVTAMEHHANYVPWQRMSRKLLVESQKDATKGDDIFRVVDITSDGAIDTNDLAKKIDKNTAIFALTHVSNVLGTINPVKDLVVQARKINPNIIVIVDAAQSAPHQKINVRDLDCDFLALSTHKMYGPTGVGILYGKKERLEQLEPFITGGEMVARVSHKKTTYKPLPYRLEAGTPHIAGVIAFKEAITYITNISFDVIHAHEQELISYALTELSEQFGDNITIYGPQKPYDRTSLLSFTLGNIHPHDIASILNTESHIAVRAGQHCAMPLHIDTLGIPATARASFSIYNDKNDVDTLIVGLKKVQEVFMK